MEENTVEELLKEKKWYEKKFFLPLLLVLITAILYSFSLPYPFLTDWDDHVFIVDNPLLVPTYKNIAVLSTTTFQDLYTPLPMLSFMLDKALFGLSPACFRAVNIFWHIISLLFFYGILRQLHIKNIFAFAGALLWAVHPQKVESIVWITERKDVLCGAFFFASLFFFLRSLRQGKIPMLATVTGFLALASKPAAVPLPGIMIVAALCLYGKKRNLVSYLKVLLLPLLVFGGMILYSYFVTKKGFPGGVETRFFVLFHNLFWYPASCLLPFELNPMYPNLKEWAWRSFFLLTGIPAVSVTLFLLYKSGLPKKVYWSFFLIAGGTMIPILGFLNYTAMDHCDRYNYLVSGSVIAFLCAGMSKYTKEDKKKKRLFFTISMLFSLLFTVRSFLYIPVWKNCDTLFAYAVRNGRPGNHTAIENGVMSAVKSNNSALLHEFVFYMLSDHKNYFPKDTHLLHTALFLSSHAHLLERKIPLASDGYRVLAKLIRSGELDLMRPSEFLPVLMRGGAEVTFSQNSLEDSALFFQEYFKVKKERTKEYYYMLQKYRLLQEKRRKNF